MDKNIQSGLRVLIKDLLSMPSGSVRPQDNQPIEGNNFAIMRVTDTEYRGWAGGSENAQQQAIDTVTLDFFGVRASNYAGQLKIAMQTPLGVEGMTKLGLGFIDCENARDLTALELDQIDRYQVKMRVSYLISYIPPDEFDSYGSIESVPIDMIAEP